MDDNSKLISKDSAGSEPSAPNGDPNGEPDVTNVFRGSTVGEPDTLPLVFCRKCNVEVKPEGKGRCPRCGTFLRLNFVARRHPINKLRRDHILATLIADYRPDTTVLRAKCEHLAGILEQLEVLKAGSQEHKRLVELSEQLGATLEESKKAAAIANPNNITVIRRIIVEPDGREYDQDTVTGIPSHHGLIPVSEENHASAAPQPASEPFCTYGCGTLARCAQIRETNPGLWRTFHYTDPEEVKRRDDLATKEMYESLRRYGPARY